MAMETDYYKHIEFGNWVKLIEYLHREQIYPNHILSLSIHPCGNWHLIYHL